MTTIVTPRAPLNLFEVVRFRATDVWTDFYTVPGYQIPASGPTPVRNLTVAAILNSLLITNTSTSSLTLSIRIVGLNDNEYSVLENGFVPSNDFMLVSLERQIMLTNESIRIKTGTGQSCDLHFSFILNTREEYEVLA